MGGELKKSIRKIRKRAQKHESTKTRGGKLKQKSTRIQTEERANQNRKHGNRTEKHENRKTERHANLNRQTSPSSHTRTLSPDARSRARAHRDWCAIVRPHERSRTIRSRPHGHNPHNPHKLDCTTKIVHNPPNPDCGICAPRLCDRSSRRFPSLLPEKIGHAGVSFAGHRKGTATRNRGVSWFSHSNTSRCTDKFHSGSNAKHCKNKRSNTGTAERGVRKRKRGRERGEEGTG